MKYFILIPIYVLFSSCHFYHSMVPITSADKATVDQRILGKWFVADDKGKVLDSHLDEYLDVIDFNGKEYALVAQSPEGRTLFKIHSSTLKGKTFLNILQRDNYDGEIPKYFFFVIDSVGIETASLRYITDSFQLQFDNSKALYKYLNKNFDLLDRKWMSEAIFYHRESFFLWDKIHTQKSTNLENMWIMSGNVYDIKDKSAAQLSIMEKTQLEKAFAVNLISNAYPILTEPEDFSHQQTYLLKFNNESYIVLHMSHNQKSFYNFTEKRYYMIKGSN